MYEGGWGAPSPDVPPPVNTLLGLYIDILHAGILNMLVNACLVIACCMLTYYMFALTYTACRQVSILHVYIDILHASILH